MHILIIKHGALGDVVRTSYFAGSLRRKWGEGLRLSWLTADAAVPLLKFNPYLDDIWTSFQDCMAFHFDQVYSLDDETAVLVELMRVRYARVTGPFLDKAGKPIYTSDCGPWFDMGLLSRFGKATADALKKQNHLGHAEIFSRILEVDDVRPEFFGDPSFEPWATSWISAPGVHVAINPFAGGRWPSKELRGNELRSLIDAMLAIDAGRGNTINITLVGAGRDEMRNRALVAELGDRRVRVAETGDSVLRLAALIGRMDYVITSDSLALHVAVAQRVPFLAFFSPTSAAEIDSFGQGRKLLSLAPDYCSYRQDADNSTITCDRLLTVFLDHATELRLLDA